MKNLEDFIARFTGDIIRAVRAATLEELAELLRSAGKPGLSPSSHHPLGVLRSSSLAPSSSRRGRREAPQAEWLQKLSAEPSRTAELPEVAEITDPERLLRVEGMPASRRSQHPADSASAPSGRRSVHPSGGARREKIGADGASAPSTHSQYLEDLPTQSRIEASAEPTASTPPPVANVSVMLRANEALVRSSGAGIVIRRKRA